jgi:hypothetical protein
MRLSSISGIAIFATCKEMRVLAGGIVLAVQHGAHPHPERMKIGEFSPALITQNLELIFTADGNIRTRLLQETA